MSDRIESVFGGQEIPVNPDDLGDKVSELIEIHGIEAVEKALKSRRDQDSEGEPEPEVRH